MTRASSWGWWILSASSSVKVIACSSVDLALGDRPESWTLCTTFKYAFLDLDNWPVELPPIMTLISPSGGRGDSSIFPFSFSSLWSHPRKFLNFPCLMRFSICCFKSKHSSVSWPWSLWKRQYLFLLRLLGSPFIFSGHFKEGSSLICIRTCSIGMFKGGILLVPCWRVWLLIISVFPFFRPSLLWTRALLEMVTGVCLYSLRSLPFLSNDRVFAFIKFWAEWMSSAMD